MMNPTSHRKSLIVKSAIAAGVIILFLWFLTTSDHIRSSNVADTVDRTAIDRCATSQLKQYAVMIDAGSSGSRVHIYRFNVCGQDPILEDEIFHPIEPGLSSYGDDAQAAAESLDQLLDLAVQTVPKEQHHCTPVAVKATAGLRLLGKEKSEKILDTVRQRLVSNYPFFLPDNKSVEIMDGKDEGVYAWITVNYLLGKFQKGKRGQSAAVFDLGGASTQIVFEPAFEQEVMPDGDHKYALEYSREHYELYQHSYLGFGLREARKKIKAETVKMWTDASQPSASGDAYPHPCLPAKHTEKIPFDRSGHEKEVKIQGTGAGYTSCRALVERIFDKEKTCHVSPCAFDGVYQPSLSNTFKQRDLLVFSFFYDITQPLGLPMEFSVAEIGDLANRVCSGDTTSFEHIPGALALLSDEPDQCLDLTYLYSLLRIGYDIPPERLVRTAKKIAGIETGWCLGASIALIDAVDVCRIE